MQSLGYLALGLLAVPPRAVIMVGVGLLVSRPGERPTAICCRGRVFACSLRGWTCFFRRAPRGAACWRGTCPSTSGELVASFGSSIALRSIR